MKPDRSAEAAVAPPLGRPVRPWWPEYLMSTRTDSAKTYTHDELLRYAEAYTARGDDCGRLARIVVEFLAAGEAQDIPQHATEPMQKVMLRAVLLRKSMGDVWRAALQEAGLLKA
jgi:hypothetical protein